MKLLKVSRSVKRADSALISLKRYLMMVYTKSIIVVWQEV